MRPIELTFNGINSYSVEQSIDFRTLTTHKIFGIVGKTGSGKTTIIDALILALYGKIPRYSLNKDSGFINTDIGECFVMFKFSITNDKDEKFYKVHRAYKLDKENKLKIVKSTLVLENSDGDESLISDKIIDKSTNKEKSKTISSMAKEVDEKIIEIIGLNYDDFTKAVILPQGKFNDFLMLKNADKGAVLERIFSLEKYGKELTDKFNKEKYENDEKIKNLCSVISTIGDVTKEDIKATEEKIINIEQKISLLKKEIDEKNKEISKKKEIGSLLSEYKNFEVKLNDFLKKDTYIKDMEQKIINGENANKLKITIDNYNEYKKNFELSKKNVEQLTERKKQNEDLEEKCSEEKRLFFEKKDKEYENILSEITEIRSLIEDTKSIEIYENKRNKLRNEHKIISNNIKELQLNLDKNNDKNRLLNEKFIYNNSKLSENTFESSDTTIFNKGIQNIERILKLKNMQKEKLNKILKEEDSIKNISCELNLLEQAKITLEEKEILQRENKKIYYSNKLKKYLDDKDDCPICGNKILALNVQHTIESENKNFDENLENLIQQNSMQIQSKTDNLRFIKKTITEETEQVKSLQEDINVLILENIDIKNKKKIYNFSKSLEEIKIKENLYQKYTKENVSIMEELSGVQAEINKLSKQINEEIIIKNNIIKEGQYLKSQIDEIDNKIKQKTNGQDKEIYLNNLNSKKDEFNKKEKIVILNYENIIKEKNEISNNLYKCISEQENYEKLLNETYKIVELEIKSFNFENIDEIFKYVLPEEQIKEYKNEVEDYKKNLHLFEKNKENAREKCENLGINPLEISEKEFATNLDKLIYEKNEQEENLSINNTELGTLKEVLKNMIETEDKAKNIKSELKICEDKRDVLQQIIKLISGNKFVKFVAKRYLHHICLDASNRLYKMSEGKFSLEQDETDFAIKDHSRGNITRQVESISGGEQFMVSLCLALSLSSYVSRKNSGQMDMFFLDEGFGSLDDETLDSVVNILFGASNDDLSIGVITHVSKLQESLPRKIIVKQNDELLSSVITMA